MQKQYVFTEKEYLAILRDIQSASEILQPMVEEGCFDAKLFKHLEVLGKLHYSLDILKGCIELNEETN